MSASELFFQSASLIARRLIDSRAPIALGRSKHFRLEIADTSPASRRTSPPRPPTEATPSSHQRRRHHRSRGARRSARPPVARIFSAPSAPSTARSTRARSTAPSTSSSQPDAALLEANNRQSPKGNFGLPAVAGGAGPRKSQPWFGGAITMPGGVCGARRKVQCEPEIGE